MTAAQPDIEHSDRPSEYTRPVQRERMKAAQDVAASVAHELRNPVFAIASAAQLLRYRVSDDPVIEKNIGRILREADRLNTLVNALLEFGRPDPVRLAPADPDDVWAAVIQRHRGDLEARAILVQHSPALPRATCAIDAGQLAQAFANALTNAIEAAAEGSDVVIHSSISGDGAWISTVRNDGATPDTDTLSRAFQPLVTTKPGHAGIGLATAHRIVTDHAGTLALGTDGDATTLTFTLPAVHG